MELSGKRIGPGSCLWNGILHRRRQGLRFWAWRQQHVRISDAKNLGVCIPLIFFLFGLMMQASADSPLFTVITRGLQRKRQIS
jgi:hypothetical protein